MSKSQARAEYFTKVVFPFVFARTVGPGSEGEVDLVPERPEIDLSSLRVRLVGKPDKDRPEPIPLWEPLDPNSRDKMVARLVDPVAQEFKDDSKVRAYQMTKTVRERVQQKLYTTTNREKGRGAQGERNEDGTEERTADKLSIEGKLFYDLVDVQLFLFDTGVGCLAVEFSLKDWMPLEPGERQRRPVSAEDVAALLNEFQAPKGKDQRKPRGEIGRDVGYSERPQGSTPSTPVSTPVVEGIPQEPGVSTRLSEFVEGLRKGRRFHILEVAKALTDDLAQGELRRYPENPEMHALSFLRVPTSLEGSPSPRYEDLADTFFRVRRMYGTRYKPPPQLVQIEGNPEVYQPFDQVFHGICAEGMAVLVLDDGTPFFGEFSDRVRHGYFTLFLMTLHQRLSLEFLASRMSRMPRLTLVCRPQVGEQDQQTQHERMEKLVERVVALRHAAFDLSLHHTFPWVSSVTMYQEVYERLLKAMRIRQLQDDLEDSIEELDDLIARESRTRREELARQELRRQEDLKQQMDKRLKEEQRRQDAKDRKAEAAKRRMEILVALLAPVALLLAFWGTNFAEVVGPSQGQFGLFSLTAFVTYFVCGALVLGMCVLLGLHKAIPSVLDRVKDRVRRKCFLLGLDRVIPISWLLKLAKSGKSESHPEDPAQQADGPNGETGEHTA